MILEGLKSNAFTLLEVSASAFMIGNALESGHTCWGFTSKSLLIGGLFSGTHA